MTSLWVPGYVECEPGFDAEFCPDPVPSGYSWCMVYAGGSSAAHVWTAAELARVAHLPRLPVLVPTPGVDVPETAAAEFLDWLQAEQVSPGNQFGVRQLVLWDLETGKAGGDDPGWYKTAANLLAARGYDNASYGSVDTLFGAQPLPIRSGFVVADWTGTPHLYQAAGVLGTQYATDVETSGGAIDISVLSSAAMGQLWRPETGQ